MTSKTLPPIDDELRGRGRRVDLKAIRQKGDADDATIEENSRLLGNEWGASISLQRTQPPAYPCSRCLPSDRSSSLPG